MRVRMSRDFRSLVDRVNRMEWPSQNAIPAEDRWAYTPEAIASLRRALADVKAGRIFELSEEDLLAGEFPKRPRRRG
ncbi:MAG: hypothetical protein E6H94_00340 [Chloroflexi bacterium]|nr:MAG: hypothetical protein E6H94_00340 [Chloroflexota bacterium]